MFVICFYILRHLIMRNISHSGQVLTIQIGGKANLSKTCHQDSSKHCNFRLKENGKEQ